MREYYNEDCMQGMKRYPDNFFDLAIVDPPYGISINKNANGIGGV
jgi:site-specific DNA-methyltransferase (adenine-specific)